MEVKYPNELMGVTSDKPIERNAAAVVKFVTNIALEARRYVRAIRFSRLPVKCLADCFQASLKMKKSSAATPNRMKMQALLRVV